MIAAFGAREILSLSADLAGFRLPGINGLLIVALAAAAAAVPLSLLVSRIGARRAAKGKASRSRRRRSLYSRQHPALRWLIALALIVELEADNPAHDAWMQRHGWVFAALMALRLAEVAAGFAWTRYLRRRVAARARALRAGEAS
jgi:hypothetical protein